jgi:flagellum-specific ATP synthase
MLNSQIASFQTHVEHAKAHMSRPEPRRYGMLTRIVGLTIEARGITATVGAICRILKNSAKPDDRSHYVDAQVVGFQSGTVFMMPLWDAAGLHAGAKVYLRSDSDSAPVGENLLGRVVDALGEPLDGMAPIKCSDRRGLQGPANQPHAAPAH